LDQRTKLIYPKLAVVTPVSTIEGKIEVFGNEYFIPDGDLKIVRQAQARPATISAGTTFVSFKCKDYSLAVRRDREQETNVAMQGGLQSPLLGDTLVATQNVNYGVEAAVITAVTSASVTNTAGAAALWTDYTNAAYNPVEDVRARAYALYLLTGITQGQLTLFVGEKAARALRQSDPIRQTYFSGAAATTEMTDAQLAAAFGVKEVVVASGLHTVAGVITANLGTTAVLAYVGEEAQGDPYVTVYPTAIRWLQYKDITFQAYDYNKETRVEGGDVSYFGVSHVVSYNLLAKITSVVS
jgi:hypothetical protein